MIRLEQYAEGVLLPVRAQPSARQSTIRGQHHQMLRVAVTQAPEKGKANKAIVEVLASALDVRKSQIELLSGETSHDKRFLIRGVTVDELSARLDAILK